MKRAVVLSQLALVVAALAVLNMRSSVQAAPVLEGLYTFSNSGNLGLDSSGNGHNLNVAGGVTSSGGNGPAFNGTNNSSASSPAATFNGSNGLLSTATGDVPSGFPIGGSTYTVTAWVNTNTGGNSVGTAGGIIGWGNYGTNTEVNAFRLSGGSAIPTASQGLLNYWWGDDLINKTATTVDNTWHMLAATYDGTTRTLYVDGTNVLSDTPGTPSVHSNGFAIGETNSNEFFQGNMADVAVYAGALSQAQLQGIFNGQINYSLLATPEPSSCLMCGLGAIGLFCAVRRQRKMS